MPRHYRYSFMKIYKEGLPYLMDQMQTNQISTSDFCFLLWLANAHKPDSTSLIATQSELAKKYGRSASRIRAIISKLRKLGWVQTYFAKGRMSCIMINPSLFMFSSDPKIIGWHQSTWEKICNHIDKGEEGEAHIVEGDQPDFFSEGSDREHRPLLVPMHSS